MNEAFTGNGAGNNNRMDTYTYDAAGNLLNDGVHNYAYDAENRIVTVDLGATNGGTTYTYDALGRRVEKNFAGAITDYVYDLQGHASTESIGGVWTRSELYAGGHHVATYESGTTYFDHADWLGTERARSDITGARCEAITSLPFGDGEAISTTCSDPSTRHFTGKERDSESGLDSFGARHDASALGRWTSPDPSGLSFADALNPQSLNLYLYVQDNPLAFVDPDGLGVIPARKCGWIRCLLSAIINAFDGGGDDDGTLPKPTPFQNLWSNYPTYRRYPTAPPTKSPNNIGACWRPCANERTNLREQLCDSNVRSIKSRRLQGTSSSRHRF